MRKIWKLATAAGAAVVVATMGAGIAGAITSPPPNYGFDGHPDAIVAGGSDTTAKLMLTLTDLWNGSAINNGCHHSQNSTATTVAPQPLPNPNVNSVFQNACDNTDVPFNQSNYDGDTLSAANPTGSGAGRAALEGTNGGHYEGTVNALANPGRTDAVVFTTNSALVQDDTISAGDVGMMITTADTHVPAPVYVGVIVPNTPVGHTSFRLSASQNAQKDALYNGTGVAGSITISRYGCLPVGPTGGPVPDIGRSSSVAGANNNCTNTNAGPTELGGATFWGYAHDEVEVYGFTTDGHATSNGNKLNNTANLTADMLSRIWDDTGLLNNGPLCPGSATKHFMTWGQLDATQWPPADPFFAAPIVPWKMNTGSGTFNTFRDWVRGHVTNGDTAFDPGSNTLDPCARTLDQASVNPTITNGPSFPLENDIKPLLNTPGLLGSSLSTVATSVDNPENWIHWASFGVYSAFPYTSTASLGGHTYAANAAAVNGKLPSTNIVTITYPITRILWNVTRKGDADCPGLVASGLPGGVRDCDFAGQPGPAIAAGGTDLNVTGASTGPGGAVREFVRWLCRANGTQQGKDPFTGVNYDGEITSAIQGAGFALVPAGFRTSGSRCDVNTDVLHAP